MVEWLALNLNPNLNLTPPNRTAIKMKIKIQKIERLPKHQVPRIPSFARGSSSPMVVS
jgi:hypothetical protein